VPMGPSLDQSLDHDMVKDAFFAAVVGNDIKAGRTDCARGKALRS
jgi:hypothetical protein